MWIIAIAIAIGMAALTLSISFFTLIHNFCISPTFLADILHQFLWIHAALHCHHILLHININCLNSCIIYSIHRRNQFSWNYNSLHFIFIHTFHVVDAMLHLFRTALAVYLDFQDDLKHLGGLSETSEATQSRFSLFIKQKLEIILILSCFYLYFFLLLCLSRLRMNHFYMFSTSLP